MTQNNLGATVYNTRGKDIASASELPLVADGDYFQVTGTTTITSMKSLTKVGRRIYLEFTSVLTIVHHATDLILPGGSDITTGTGDILAFIEYAIGKWICFNYMSEGSSATPVPHVSDGVLYNLGVGINALTGISTGQNNVAVGENAGDGVFTGLKNTILGVSAGRTIGNGSNNTILGYNADTNLSGDSNAIVIGSEAISQGGNTTVIGNSSTTATYLMGDLNITDSGHIRFPATASPAGAANVMDDYEVGTWTPAFHFSGGSVGITYTSRQGYYQKIGRHVTCTGSFFLSSKGTSVGTGYVDGLPFSTAATQHQPVLLFASNLAYVGSFQARLDYTSDRIIFYLIVEAGTVAGLSNAYWANNTGIQLSVSYDVVVP